MMLGLDGPAAMAGPHATQRKRKAKCNCDFHHGAARLTGSAAQIPMPAHDRIKRARTAEHATREIPQ